MTERGERVELHGVEDVDTDDSAKTVTDAWMILEPTFGAAPNRQLLVVETWDETRYTFQRYGSEEPFVKYLRHPGDGSDSRPLRGGNIPRNVDKIRGAVEDKDVLPEFEDLIHAEERVSDGLGRATATDGGTPREDA